MTGVFFIAAGALIFVGTIWFLIEAFSEGALWGLGCLLIPLVSLLFLVRHFDKAKVPFLLQVLGFGLFWVVSPDDFQELVQRRVLHWRASNSQPSQKSGSTAPSADVRKQPTETAPRVSSVVCSRQVAAYDPAMQSRQIGSFKENSRLVIGRIDEKSQMTLVTYQDGDGKKISAWCKLQDLGLNSRGSLMQQAPATVSQAPSSTPYPAEFIVPEPDPMPTNQELNADSPTDEDLKFVQWKTISQLQAEAFSYVGGNDTHCNLAWRDAVKGMEPTSRCEMVELRGRKNLCTWYAMRIVNQRGVWTSSLIRPGPRI